MKVELGNNRPQPETVMLSSVNFGKFAMSPDGSQLYFVAGKSDEWLTLKSGRLQEVNSYGIPVIVLPAGTQIVLTSEK